MTCDKCGNPARVHSTEIRGGQTIEQHLCEQCAAAQDDFNFMPKCEVCGSISTIRTVSTSFVAGRPDLSTTTEKHYCEKHAPRDDKPDTSG